SAIAKQSAVEETRCPISLPIKNQVDLQEAENILAKAVDSSTFFNWCETVGGKDLKHHVSRLLSRIFAHTFSLQINFSGSSNKKGSTPKLAFREMKICTILIGAVAKAHDVTENDVELRCGRWFRGSSDRDGGRKKRN
ncbi:unnamed protein product, partial [Allacma fusca]